MSNSVSFFTHMPDFVRAGKEIDGELQAIAQGCKEAWSFEQITLCRGEGRLECHRHINFFFFLPRFIEVICSIFQSDEVVKENQQTIEYLYERFGKSRVVAVCSRFDISIEHMHDHGLALYKYQLDAIFVGLGTPFEEDLKCTYGMIASGQRLPWAREQEMEPIRSFFQSEIQRHHFQVNQLSGQHIKTLYKITQVFPDRETMFLGNLPRPSWILDKGASRSGYRNIASILARVSYGDEKIDSDLLDTRIVKRLLGVSSRLGMVIPINEGCLKIHQIVSGFGSDIVFTRALGRRADGYRSRVYCLPTQLIGVGPNPFASVFNSMVRGIGIPGTMSNYEKVHDQLLNPGAEFVDEPFEPVIGVGYSLGGAVLQRVVHILYPTQVFEKAHFVNNPGVDMDLVEQFRTSTEQVCIPIELLYSTNHGDLTTTLGDGNIGIGVNPQTIGVRYMILHRQGEEEELDVSNPDTRLPHPPQGFFSAVSRLFGSLGTVHGEDRTEEPFTTTVVDNQNHSDLIDQYLTSPHGGNWERHRQVVAHRASTQESVRSFLEYAALRSERACQEQAMFASVAQ
ncbi:MAG: hypothetical protein S4CHLAM102_10290 [Chlamydiia bacterium]|nr:hypothetical protein [Chlamydiia bacterium]